jgi:hypothetical protein
VRYLLLIHDTESLFATMPPQEIQKMMQAYGSFREELQAAGAFRDAARLRPVASATTVRVRDGKKLTTDGPFAETKEQLGGFFLIEAKDMNEACAVASRFPPARIGIIEVRPVRELKHS